MAELRAQRRLAAILAADVVGYSRLIENDEEGTRARLRSLHSELIDPKIESDSGRVVKATGDGILVEFSSAVDAVRNALDLQGALRRRNADVSKDVRIEFRVGINVGDVIVEGDDIHGDGVNVAARLESLCQPGEVYISGTVYDQVMGKLAASFEDLGERTVKNIAKPVRIYRALLGPDHEQQFEPQIFDAPPLFPDQPSIAVLPFQNMSGDLEQEFFSDGITEDIITTLSKIPELQVIARNSTYVHKGHAVKVSEIGRDLGVEFVLEGSVRASNNRLRITAQLIETNSDRHVWAERYDRDVSDLFALQDEIANEIAIALQVNLSEGDQARLRRRQTNSLEAWECFVRGSQGVVSATRAKYDEARELLERAVSLDPKFAIAWVKLASLHWQVARAYWTDTPDRSLEKAADYLQRALAIDETLPDAHAYLGLVYLIQRRFEDAIAAGERAIDLGANTAEAYVILAHTLSLAGKPSDALALLERATRLYRFYPDHMLGVLALCYRMLGRYEEAIALDTERLRRNPDNVYSDVRLASLYMV